MRTACKIFFCFQGVKSRPWIPFFSAFAFCLISSVMLVETRIIVVFTSKLGEKVDQDWHNTINGKSSQTCNSFVPQIVWVPFLWLNLSTHSFYYGWNVTKQNLREHISVFFQVISEIPWHNRQLCSNSLYVLCNLPAKGIA